MTDAIPVLRPRHFGFGRALASATTGRVALGGEVPSPSQANQAARRAVQLATDHAIPLRERAAFVCLEPDGRCLWVRVSPAPADVHGRPGRRYHLVWFSAEELRDVGYCPWLLDEQFPDLEALTAKLGPLAIVPEPTRLDLAPRQLVEALALADRIAAGDAVELPASDPRLGAVWLACVQRGLAGLTLVLRERQARFVPAPVAEPEDEVPPLELPARSSRVVPLFAGMAFGLVIVLAVVLAQRLDPSLTRWFPTWHDVKAVLS